MATQKKVLTNPTCPQCQTQQELVTGFADATGMSIILECLKGHRELVEMPVSRFVDEADDNSGNAARYRNTRRA